jgi:glycosyltransferase involved in cell wall biosynthesis
MKVSVIVPTYRRPHDLARCIESLKAQKRLPDETIVVVRDIDDETNRMLDGFDFGPLAVRRVVVDVPGQVAALNAGIEAAEGDIVAITDDDGAPHPDWIGRTERWMEDEPAVGGVGGPDWLEGSDHNGSADVCGQVQWFGRIATWKGGVTDVDILKGCNMTYRRAAIGDTRFDDRLRGSGAQVFNDFAFSLAVRRKHWRLVYDPDVAIDHYQSARSDEDQRNMFVREAHTNATHNRSFLMLLHLRPANRVAYLAYALLVGSRPLPGLAVMVRETVRREPNTFAYWTATVVGHVAAVRTFLRTRTRPS